MRSDLTVQALLQEQLVPGRVCGECTACCKAVTIDLPDFKKPPGVLCVHCGEKSGCRIHDTRPQVCRTWYCGWRIRGNLNDSWRPDRSSVLIALTTEEIPPAFPQLGYTLCLIGSLKVIFDDAFVWFVTQHINIGFPLFLLVPGPPGHSGRKVFLNTEMADVVASNDRELIVRKLTSAVESCLAAQEEAIEPG